MSTSVVRGVITNFSPKPSEDYYGILVDEGKEGDNWYNGNGDVPGNLSKGNKVKLKINKDEFCEIQEINVMESGGSEGDTSNSAPKDGSASDSATFIPKQESIRRNVAFKEAVETVRQTTAHLDDEEARGEHQQRIAEVANGYYNILKSMGENQ